MQVPVMESCRDLKHPSDHGVMLALGAVLHPNALQPVAVGSLHVMIKDLHRSLGSRSCS